jgi:hypothetical protein
MSVLVHFSPQIAIVKKWVHKSWFGEPRPQLGSYVNIIPIMLVVLISHRWIYRPQMRVVVGM